MPGVGGGGERCSPWSALPEGDNREPRGWGCWAVRPVGLPRQQLVFVAEAGWSPALWR